MKHSEFKINQFFYSVTGRWLCTDIGTRIIAAIKLDKDVIYSGPPYDIQEVVFDEYDFEGCSNKTLIE